MEPRIVQQDGLSWTQKTFGLEPCWTLEPAPSVIQQTIQSFWPSSTVKVGFLAQGAFNKIYEVSIDDDCFIMRVSLPVDPHYKTRSEVATMDWVRRITRLPVPEIITYESSPENPIGFEWILMTKMPGRPLGEVWRSLPFSGKSRLVRECAIQSACLFRHQLQGIGNIYGESSGVQYSLSTNKSPPSRGPVNTKISAPAKAQGSDGTSHLLGNKCPHAALPEVGRIVSMQFFWGSRIHRDIHRGPFRSSKDWMAARLMLSQLDCHSSLDKYSTGRPDSDEDEIEDATRTLQIIDQLNSLLPLMFPTSGDDFEPSVIFHDDLSKHNILVDDVGQLAGALDWECVSALPLWKACYYPSFLEEPPRHSEPDVERYHREANGEPSDLYFEHLWEYEATLLRGIFIDEMARLDPGWMEVFEKSQSKRDFDIAVQNCDNELVARHIDAWIRDITASQDNLRSLRDRIDED